MTPDTPRPADPLTEEEPLDLEAYVASFVNDPPITGETTVTRHGDWPCRLAHPGLVHARWLDATRAPRPVDLSRTNTDHLSVPVIIGTYVRRLIEAEVAHEHSQPVIDALVEERDVLLAWWATRAPRSDALRAAAIKACEAHYDEMHVRTIKPCATAMRDAEWWAAALATSATPSPDVEGPLDLSHWLDATEAITITPGLARQIARTIPGVSHGRPFYYDCTVPGCTLDGHHRESGS